MSQGKFITLEGGEGAGKSTQAALLRDRLQAAKLRVVMTREPGGSPRAETIRGILLSGQAKRFGPLAETVLFYVARDSHLELTVRPALARGAWVVCDRFFDSTRAYQGAAGGVSLAALDAFERAKARAEMAKDGAPDRFESMEIAFHNNLRQEFLDIAAVEPKRCALVDAARSIDAISADIWAVVKQRLNAV